MVAFSICCMQFHYVPLIVSIKKVLISQEIPFNLSTRTSKGNSIDLIANSLDCMLQNRRKGEIPSEESKTICSELASAINDGLYFYEQVVDCFVNFVFLMYRNIK